MSVTKMNQHLRILWIDAFCRANGCINRSDIVAAWGISAPQATNDLTAFAKAYPRRLRYDVCRKTYVYHDTGRGPKPKGAGPLIQFLNEYLNSNQKPTDKNS